jgi:hypothetical protein
MTLKHEKTKQTLHLYNMCYYDYTPFIIAIVVNEFFLDGKFSSKFNLKNMILIYTKDFMK